MSILIWIGSAIAVAGVIGIFLTGLSALKLRNSGLDDDAMRAGLQKGVTRNMISLFVAVIGLMTVIMGLFLR